MMVFRHRSTNQSVRHFHNREWLRAHHLDTRKTRIFRWDFLAHSFDDHHIASHIRLTSSSVCGLEMLSQFSTEFLSSSLPTPTIIFESHETTSEISTGFLLLLNSTASQCHAPNTKSDDMRVLCFGKGQNWGQGEKWNNIVDERWKCNWDALVVMYREHGRRTRGAAREKIWKPFLPRDRTKIFVLLLNNGARWQRTNTLHSSV